MPASDDGSRMSGAAKVGPDHPDNYNAHLAAVVPQCGFREDGNHLVLGITGRSVVLVPHYKDVSASLAHHASWRLIGGPDGFQFEGSVENPGAQYQGSVQVYAPYENSPATLLTTIAWDTAPRPEGLNGRQWRAVSQGNGEWFAFQLVSNPKQNLNVGGGGPYKAGDQIYSYKWGDGQSNELWKFIWLD